MASTSDKIDSRMQEVWQLSAVASPSSQLCFSIPTFPRPRKIGRAVGKGWQKSKRRLHSLCGDFGLDGFFMCLLLRHWSYAFNGGRQFGMILGRLVFHGMRVSVNNRQRGLVAFDVELMAVILHCCMECSLTRIAKAPILPISAIQIGW